MKRNKKSRKKFVYIQLSIPYLYIRSTTCSMFQFNTKQTIQHKSKQRVALLNQFRNLCGCSFIDLITVCKDWRRLLTHRTKDTWSLPPPLSPLPPILPADTVWSMERKKGKRKVYSRLVSVNSRKSWTKKSDLRQREKAAVYRPLTNAVPRANCFYPAFPFHDGRCGAFPSSRLKTEGPADHLVLSV